MLLAYERPLRYRWYLVRKRLQVDRPSTTVAFSADFWIHGQPWFEDRGRGQRRL